MPDRNTGFPTWRAREESVNQSPTEELVSGLFTGCAIAGPVSFMVIFLSARNVVLVRALLALSWGGNVFYDIISTVGQIAPQ